MGQGNGYGAGPGRPDKGSAERTLAPFEREEWEVRFQLNPDASVILGPDPGSMLDHQPLAGMGPIAVGARCWIAAQARKDREGAWLSRFNEQYCL